MYTNAWLANSCEPMAMAMGNWMGCVAVASQMAHNLCTAFCLILHFKLSHANNAK